MIKGVIRLSIAFKIVPTPDKVNNIRATLTGYWQNAVWDIRDSFFDGIRPQNWTVHTNVMNFNLLPLSLRDEAKFFYATRLADKIMRVQSAFQYGTCFYRLADFLNHTYPDAISFVDIPIEKAMIKWRSYLIGLGRNVGKNGRLSTDAYEVILLRFCTFYRSYYDTRDEFDKDIWNVRNIPGARFSMSSTQYVLNLTKIPSVFCPLVKKYMKVRIGTLSLSQCQTDVNGIRKFLGYISKKYPTWATLQLLSRDDIESYLSWFRQNTAGMKKMHFEYIISLRTFLKHIQQANYPEAPTTPVVLLIWKEDIPRLPLRSDNSIKFIPEGVLQQLEYNLEHLEPAECIPIVVLLRASGWRISDILNLRYDMCLDKTPQGWWLCGDIPKTQVLNHRVPITDEVAAIVKTTIEEITKKSTSENNPEKYLFVRLEGSRKGLPPDGRVIRTALNRLAEKCNIVDDQGKVYCFGNHAFRHTKGVELINNGMNILHVQKWLAHASPEMTLTYARILDSTMRKSWEAAMQNGAFRLNENGKPIKINLSELENEDIIEWEYIRHNLDAVRMPLGYCLKPKKVDCKHQLNPCLNCRNLCTTPDFISQYELEIREVKALIERGKVQNQTLWVEKNQHLLERYEAILAVLKEGKAHHLAGKKGREYVGEERQNVKPSA